MEVKKHSNKVDPSKISPIEFIDIVNRCLADYYGNPSLLLGLYDELSWDMGKIKSKEDFEEFCRSRSFTTVFEDLVHSNHWHQAIHFLSNCVDNHIPHYSTVQKILDMMLVIDDNSFVMAAQMYLYKLVCYYPPKDETLQQFYHDILKEEKMEEKRVSSPKDPCGSFINVIHQFAMELEKIEVEKRGAVVTSYEIKKKVSEDDSEEGEDEALTNEAECDLLDLCDIDVLTGVKLRSWWINANSEDRIHRLLSLFVIMMEIFYIDLGKCLKRSKSTQRRPFNRPIISRLVWPYENHGDPSIMLIKMIITMYTISFKLEIFSCLTEFEKLISFIAVTLPASPLDNGEGYPPDSHQRRVFAQDIADSLESSDLDDDRIEIALARLKPSWLRSLVGTKILNKHSETSCGDLPLNVAQLAQMIIKDLNWSELPESDEDNPELMDLDQPSSSKKGRKKRGVKRNSKGETDLHVYCRKGLSDKLSEELEKGGKNINLTDYAGWTALHEAVYAGHLECVRKLLEYQPKKIVYQTRCNKNKMLESAEQDQEPKELKTTVNLHVKAGDMGLTPLHEAVIHNRILIADLLLKYGEISVIAKRLEFPGSGGLSNLLYYCALPEDRRGRDSGGARGRSEPSAVLLRLYGQTTGGGVGGDKALEGLITESVIFALLSESQRGPCLFGVFPGGRLEEYIPARPLHTKELADKGLSRLIAEKVAQIHLMKVPINKEPRWLWDTMERWLVTIHEYSTSGLIPDASKAAMQRFVSYNLRKELDWLREYLVGVQSPVVFCHNDLQEGNILLRANNGADAGAEMKELNAVVDQEEGEESPGADGDEYREAEERWCHGLAAKDTEEEDEEVEEENGRWAEGDEDAEEADPRQLVVIDFEYCSYNYRAFDFANHMCEWMYDYSNKKPPYFTAMPRNFPSRKQQEQFVRWYLGALRREAATQGVDPPLRWKKKREEEGDADDTEETQALLSEIRAFTLASHFFWALWSIVNGTVSSIPFDYWEYGESRFRAYFRHKRRLLKEAPPGCDPQP